MYILRLNKDNATCLLLNKETLSNSTVSFGDQSVSDFKVPIKLG